MADIPEGFAAKLFRGEMTLAEFFGLSPQQLGEIAEAANGLVAAGQLEPARRLYEGLVAASPYDPQLHYLLARTLQALEEDEPALAHYSEAIHANPMHIDARVERGELLIRKNRQAEGIADLEAAIEKDPQLTRESSQRGSVTLQRLKRK